MGRIVEGLWDCSHCGGKGIRGGLDECPHCGKRRDETVKFYMPDKITYVDETVAGKISRKPDWICSYCNCLNSDDLNYCKSCGATRNAENVDYFQNKKAHEKQSKNVCESSTNESITSSTISNQTNETVDSNLSDFSNSVRAEENTNDVCYEKTRFQRFLSKAHNSVVDLLEVLSENIPVIVLVAIIACVIFALVPKTKNVTIDHKYWERSVEIEAFKTEDESDWKLPEGARLHDSRTEIYKYERVIDHYEDRTKQVSHQRITGYKEKVVGYRDLGNGHFEEITKQEPIYETYYETEHYQEPVYRQQPIYKTKYYYEIDKWVHDRTLSSSGTDNNPYWADTSGLNSNEREGKKDGKYSVYVTTSKGKSMEIDIPYDQWSDLSNGETVKMRVSIFGNGKIVT